MNSERTAQLQVALASYDLRELRVQKRYLQEQGTAIVCTCFCSGEKLLAQLRQGVRYDAVVLCSELTDLSAEQFVRQLYPIDLCELLQQVSAQSDMIRAQLGVDIRLDYGGCTACCVMADRRDAELLCLHLLSNALRASREGGCVCIALRRTESGWQLTVTDDGCGLPGEDVQAALENRRSFLGGAQLGLLLCRECCRRMDWSLQLEPAPAKGTRAVVSIPLYTGESCPDGTVELRTDSETEREQRKYHLRAMLVREMRTMPERGDPDEEL